MTMWQAASAGSLGPVLGSSGTGDIVIAASVVGALLALSVVGIAVVLLGQLRNRRSWQREAEDLLKKLSERDAKGSDAKGKSPFQ